MNYSKKETEIINYDVIDYVEGVGGEIIIEVSKAIITNEEIVAPEGFELMAYGRSEGVVISPSTFKVRLNGSNVVPQVKTNAFSVTGYTYALEDIRTQEVELPAYLYDTIGEKDFRYMWVYTGETTQN